MDTKETLDNIFLGHNFRGKREYMIRGSILGIATGYGLTTEGPEFESGRGKNFRFWE
jgi:hypothetical protein